MPHRNLLIISLIALALLTGFLVWKRSHLPTPKPVPVVTEESQNQANPNPDEPIDTSDWKIYRNEEYGFEFKYPKEYVVFDDYSDKKTLFLSLPENKVHRVEGIYFRINEAAESPEKLLEQIRKNSIAWGMERLISDETVVIGKNIITRKIVYMTDIGYAPEHYFIHFGSWPVELEIRIEILYTKEILATLHSIK